MADEKDIAPTFQRWSKEAEFARSIFAGTTDSQRIAQLEAELAEARGEVGLIVEWLRAMTAGIGFQKQLGGIFAPQPCDAIYADLATAIASGAYKGQTDD